MTSDRASIEGQITAAEREYEVERVQLELLDLGQVDGELISSLYLLDVLSTSINYLDCFFMSDFKEAQDENLIVVRNKKLALRLYCK